MGKLDEELKRTSEIIEHVVPGSRIFLNESFSSTNVREGPDIAIQVINALLVKRMKIVFETYFNELAEEYIGSPQTQPFSGLRDWRTEHARSKFFRRNLYQQVSGMIYF